MSNQVASAHTSLSSSSVITVQRGPGQNSEAIHIRSASPGEGAILAAKALKASTAQRVPSRGSDLNEPEDPNITQDRASRPPSTQERKARQVGDEKDRQRQRRNASPSASPHPNRPQSGSDSSSRWKQPNANSRLGEYLPGKTDPKRNSAASSPSSRRSRPSFGPDGLQRLRASDNKSYVPSLLSPTGARPSTPGTSNTTGTRDSDDYFGLGIAVSKDESRSPALGTESTRRRIRDGLPESPTAQKHPQRNSTRRDKDKKTMLSKALEKANTAVLLDNAQNFEGALDAYTDACKLLEQVMERTAGSEDREKLEAIRNTYAARIEELTALNQQSALPLQTEKQLPPRPDSESYAPQLPQLDSLAPIDTSIAELPAELPAGPSTSTAARDRDSFLTDAIREVEGSRASGFLGPLWERSKTPLSSGIDNSRTREDLIGADAPQPLSTHSRSPNPPADTTSSHHAIEDGETGSWLNTIDESDSDDAASLHSIKNNTGIRRRDISGGEPRKVSDFDSAFDAAVEAAYEDGFEPDQGDDEQQMLDDIARDYMDQAYSFSEKSKSSFPRGSGSTAGTRDTWKSSIVGPDRGTIGTSLSTLEEDYGSVLPRSHLDQSSTSTTQTSAGTVGLASSSADVAIPTEQALRERRSNLTSGDVKPLTIETAFSKDRKRQQSTASRMTQSSQRDVEVTPWEAVDNKAEVTPWEVQPLQKAEVTPWDVQMPPTPTSAGSRGATPMEQALRERRSTRSLSNVSKPLTIETRTQRKRAPSNASRMTQSSQRDLEVAPWEAIEQKAEVTPWEVQPVQAAEATPWELQAGPFDSKPIRMGSLRKDGYTASSAMSDSGSSMLGDLASPRSKIMKTQRSSASLHDNIISVPTPTQTEMPTPTPTSGTFSAAYSKRNNSSSQLSQRSLTMTSVSTPVPPLPEQMQQQGGYYLFDTTLGRSVDNQPSSSPKTMRESVQPVSFEPCPDSPSLRPFWLMRLVANSATHPRGAYITTKLFMPREAWMNRSIKLKNVEDKIAACDLLSAALASVGQVNTYDADAVLHELQKLEEVMERVQQTLIKKLGNEVGVSNVTSLFKEADKTTVDSPQEGSARDAKSKFSWRKIRGKSVMPGSAGLTGSIKGAISETANMQTVPMTSFTGVEKRTGLRREALENAVFEGPLKDYMASLAKVCESAQAIDHIARQVEDPGLKASSTTLVGLEFSTRHAAEFFGFYLCRFMLSDIGTLIDKHVKRGTEWVLS